jgi:hypothetical protein
MTVNTGLDIAILIFLIFQFLLMLNIIRRILNELPDIIHEYAVQEINKILNDKELFDKLKNYGQGLAQGVIQGIQTKKPGRTDLVGGVLGMLLNRFLPFNMPGPGSQTENENVTEIKPAQPVKPSPKPKNPFA